MLSNINVYPNIIGIKPIHPKTLGGVNYMTGVLSKQLTRKRKTFLILTQKSDVSLTFFIDL